MGLPLQCIQHGIDLTSFAVSYKQKYNKHPNKQQTTENNIKKLPLIG